MAESSYGNQIAVYDKERVICEAIIDRKKMDVQMFQTAVKEYMSDSNTGNCRLLFSTQRSWEYGMK